MKLTAKITPNFNARNLWKETIRRDWFIFQSEIFNIGQSLTQYIQNFITTRKKRRGAKGNLEKNITFEPFISTPATVGWGIGNISLLNSNAKYWYVVNYGTTVGGQRYIPNHGNFVPGSFEGSKPDSALKGGVQKFNFRDGTGFGMYPKSPIRPLNYIQAGRRRANRHIIALIAKLRKGL